MKFKIKNKCNIFKKFIKILTSFDNDKTKYLFQFQSCESLLDRRVFDQIRHKYFNFFNKFNFKIIKNFNLILKNMILESFIMAD
jgi:hypothetical protein